MKWQKHGINKGWKGFTLLLFVCDFFLGHLISELQYPQNCQDFLLGAFAPSWDCFTLLQWETLSQIVYVHGAYYRVSKHFALPTLYFVCLCITSVCNCLSSSNKFKGFAFQQFSYSTLWNWDQFHKNGHIFTILSPNWTESKILILL